MRGFFKGLIDFIWPYIAAGIIAGTLTTLIYGLSGYVKLPDGATFWQWFYVWAIFSAVLTAICAVASIVLEIVGLVLFLVGAGLYFGCRRLFCSPKPTV